MSNSRPPSALSRYSLPGFGLPLNFPRDKYLTHDLAFKKRTAAVGVWDAMFPSALDSESTLRPVTLREFTMMRFMNHLTDKPDWDTKVFDESIIAKWKTEALTSSDTDMTEPMFTYCIDELRYKSAEFKNTGIVTVYDGDVVRSDTTIPSSLRDALRAATASLEHVPNIQRDWHPGSNGTVLDLVHPSLFPVVYGRTRILQDSIVGLDECLQRCGEGQTLRVPSKNEAKIARSSDQITEIMDNPYSRKFQWLPCDVEFDNDRVKIASYINNLHPQLHKPLYDIIEQIIDLTIPLWNAVLNPLTASYESVPRIIYFKCEYQGGRPEQDPDESNFDYSQRIYWWEQDNGQIVKPEPGNFMTPLEDTEYLDLKTQFAERGIQIIVKLANIHLTPEKPEYGGGTWHIEGQMNEHICATALYYYDNSNITESVLSFRQQCAVSDRGDIEDVTYPQEHHRWLSEIYGCKQNGPAIQYIGDVVTKEGRLLAFPNIFQHRVGPFRLADKTKAGHRKILALFLVDPHIKIISSANVPCQQKEWWAHELRAKGVFSMLPNELVKEVMDNVDDFPMGLEEAKKLRLELMEERKGFVRRHDVQFESATFSLCEH